MTDTALELRRFRTGLIDCFGRWSDTLLELCDAVLCTPGRVTSVPMLSLEGEFRRSHGSLYKALDDGHISFDALKSLLIANLPDAERRVFAVDASTWARCDAETSPERGFYYSASTHSAGQPIVAGWSYQWISQLDFDPNSWCAPADIYRIPPTVNSTQATIDQVRRLADDLDETDKPPALLVFDAGYDPIAISHELADCPVEILVRIRDDRVFHGRPPNKPDRPANTGGRPPRHGPRHKCSNPATWAPPEQTHTTSDLRYGNITIGAWSQLHPRLNSRGHWTNHETLPIVEGTIIRVEVELLPKPTSRTKKTLWLWWSGPGQPDLDLCARAYLHRFDIEHSFRFAKNTLGWVTPSICTSEQADRWTWIIAAAYTQLRLARHLIADHKLPWERPRKPHQLSPARIRRGFRALTATIGTRARPPKPSRAGPGRPKGSRSGPRPPHPAIKKTARTKLIHQSQGLIASLEHLWFDEDGTATDCPKLDLPLADGQTAPVGLLLTNSTGDTTLLAVDTDGTSTPTPPEVTSPPPEESSFPDPEGPDPAEPNPTASGPAKPEFTAVEPGVAHSATNSPDDTGLTADEAEVGSASVAERPEARTEAPSVGVAASNQRAEGGPLARTGVRVGILLAVAVGLILAGLVFLQSGRRHPASGDGSSGADGSTNPSSEPSSLGW